MKMPEKHDKPEIMVMHAIVGGELFTDTLITLQTCHAKPKTSNQQLDATSFFPLVGCLPQAVWPERLLSEKSGRCGIAAD